jgi:hypothetical protein
MWSNGSLLPATAPKDTQPASNKQKRRILQDMKNAAVE